MVKIDLKTSNRLKNYEWFSKFSNSTYSMNVNMNVTKLLKHVKEKQESFFIDLLFIVLQGLNSCEEMRIRLVNNEPYLFDDINPAFTVMTKSGVFENVRFENEKDFKKFYEKASLLIEQTKNEEKLNDKQYNPDNCYNEYYITCVPWVNFNSVAHPIPDDKASQCIPRICWGKYHEENGQYLLTLNITVSHMFVDGYPLSMTFNKIQELLDNVEEVLR